MRLVEEKRIKSKRNPRNDFFKLGKRWIPDSLAGHRSTYRRRTLISDSDKTSDRRMVKLKLSQNEWGDMADDILVLVEQAKKRR